MLAGKLIRWCVSIWVRHGIVPVSLSEVCPLLPKVQRREWKINLIKEMDSKTKAAPTDLPADLNDLEHMEYHNIKVRGVFEHDEEMYISPR